MSQPPEYPPPPPGYSGGYPPPPPQPYSYPYGQQQPPPPAKKTRWGLIIVLVLAALVLVVGAGLAALFVIFKDEIPTNAADVALGDCLSEIPSDSSLVASVHTVACTDPHKGEVYHVITVPGTEFPGETAIIDYQDKCQPALEEFSPSAMADPEVGMFVLYPTADSWKRGDRAVTCIATTEVPRTGSLQE